MAWVPHKDGGMTYIMGGGPPAQSTAPTYSQELGQVQDQRNHQAFMERYTRDLDEAEKMRRMRQGIYSSPDEMLMDEHGPAYEYKPGGGQSIDFGFAGQPSNSYQTGARVPRQEFKGAIEAMRPRNFQEVKGSPGTSRYGEDAKLIEVLNQTIMGMDPKDSDLPMFKQLLKDRMRSSLGSGLAAPAEDATAPAGGMLRDVPILGGLISLGEQFLKPKQPIMYSEGSEPLAPAAPRVASMSKPSIEMLSPPGSRKSTSQVDPKTLAAYKAKYPGRTDEEIIAAIQRGG